MKRIEVKPGDEYGRLRIVTEVDSHTQPSGKRVRRFRCCCKCGQTVTVTLTHLRDDHTTSCGCWRREISKINGQMTATHGCSNTPTFKTWDAMKQRCNNPNDERYPLYGGRGISVCQRWQDSFQAFLDDMGERPEGQTIDRIDTNGNYEPSNCRWATSFEQARNKRNNVLVTYQGKSRCVGEWAILTGISSGVLHQRVKRGWSVDDMFTIPVGTRRQRR